MIPGPRAADRLSACCHWASRLVTAIPGTADPVAATAARGDRAGWRTAANPAGMSLPQDHRAGWAADPAAANLPPSYAASRPAADRAAASLLWSHRAGRPVTATLAAATPRAA